MNKKYYIMGNNKDPLYIVDENNIVLYKLQDWGAQKIGTDLSYQAYNFKEELPIEKYIEYKLKNGA